MTTNWQILLGFLVPPLATGCFGGLHVDAVGTSVQKPSNVAVYMAVSHGEEPALGLTEQSFHVSEDGQDLTADQSKQVLLPRDMAAVHRALLLVDMSGPVAEGDTRSAIALAVARFVTKAHVSQPVSVFAFDGGAALHPIGEYPEGNDEIGDIPALSGYTAADPSSNLNGAVVEAIAQLDARLMTAQKPLRVGTLAVFARGPDLAGRVTESKMREVLNDSKDLVVAVSIKDVPGFKASRIARDGAFEADSPASILDAFDRAGTRVGGLVNRYYLLSYCSPARAGKRRLRVKVATTDEKEKEVTGTLSAEFDATGFTSGCDPTAKPRFVLQEPAAPEAKPDADARTSRPEKADKPGHPPGKPAGKPAAGPEEGEEVVPPPAKPGYAQ